ESAVKHRRTLSLAEEDKRSKELRRLAVEELIKRREDIGWIVEGDFDEYVARMARPGTWGGEPELLMLSQHVLEMPLEVYLVEDGQFKHLLTYSQELPGEAIRVLFHGQGHYEALLRV
ncbi:OTU4, partial [Symbiodinium pilosum]